MCLLATPAALVAAYQFAERHHLHIGATLGDGPNELFFFVHYLEVPATVGLACGLVGTGAEPEAEHPSVPIGRNKFVSKFYGKSLCQKMVSDIVLTETCFLDQNLFLGQKMVFEKK